MNMSRLQLTIARGGAKRTLLAGQTILLGLALTARAQLVVPADGQVFTTNTVLAPGVYSLPNGVSIGASGVTLDLNGATLAGTGFNHFGVTCVGRDNVVIKGGTIRGYYYGVRVQSGAGVRVLDNDLSGNWVDPESLTANPPWLNINAGPDLGDRVNLGGGLFAQDMTGAVISRNTLRNQENGIDLYGVRESQIDHNNVSDNTGWGIHLYASSGNRVYNNTADRCTRANLGDSAGMLLVWGSSNNLIVSNSFQHGGDGFFIGNEGGRPSNNNIVRGNNGSHAGANAFEATFSSGNQFIENIADASNYGFWLGYSHDGNVIRGNSIRANNANGIEIEHGQNNVIEANDIIGNGASGIVLRTDGLPHFPVHADPLNLPDPAVSSGYTIRNNRVHSNYGSALVLIETTGCLIVNNLFGGPYAGTATSDGPNNVWAVAPAPGTNIAGGPMLGGNWWFNYRGVDTDGDGLGDTETPYTNGGQIAAPGDPHPLAGSPDLGVLEDPATLLDHCWVDLGPNTRASGEGFGTANGAHFATDGQQLFLLEGCNSPRLSLFDPATCRYIEKAPAPEGLLDGGDFQFGGSLYYATVSYDLNPTNGEGLGPKLYAYNAQTDAWSEKAPCTVAGELVATEALACDPDGGRMYATIVQVKDPAAGGDPALHSKLAIYNPASDAWVGATSAAPDSWGVGSEAEYLDGRVYVWRGGWSGAGFSGADSYLDVYDVAAGAWTRTPSLADSGVLPGFRTGGFDVWGVSMSADPARHCVYVMGGEANRTLYVFDAASQTWAAGPAAPYDGGWGASIEYVAGSGRLFQVDGRNVGDTTQGSAVLVANTNQVRLEIAADPETVRLTARGTIAGVPYTLWSAPSLNGAPWTKELAFVGAGDTELPPIARAGRGTLFFRASLGGVLPQAAAEP